MVDLLRKILELVRAGRIPEKDLEVLFRGVEIQAGAVRGELKGGMLDTGTRIVKLNHNLITGIAPLEPKPEPEPAASGLASDAIAAAVAAAKAAEAPPEEEA